MAKAKTKKARSGSKLPEGRKLFDCDGGRCVIKPRSKGSQSARIIDPELKYTPKRAKPCNSDRASCPIQLFFKGGVPHLRFCTEKGKPGHIVPVRDAKEAQKWAARACRSWRGRLKGSKMKVGDQRVKITKGGDYGDAEIAGKPLEKLELGSLGRRARGACPPCPPCRKGTRRAR